MWEIEKKSSLSNGKTSHTVNRFGRSLNFVSKKIQTSEPAVTQMFVLVFYLIDSMNTVQKIFRGSEVFYLFLLVWFVLTMSLTQANLAANFNLNFGPLLNCIKVVPFWKMNFPISDINLLFKRMCYTPIIYVVTVSLVCKTDFDLLIEWCSRMITHNVAV